MANKLLKPVTHSAAGTSVGVSGSYVGYAGATPVSIPITVTGAKGSNVALASVIAALVSLGLVTDSTTT